MKPNTVVDSNLARRVLDVVDKGLCSGVGEPVPGKMCVEAAVCYALGEPHGDKPSCVGDAVRAFKIQLNDADWSSKEARANGMREIAVAQLGSNSIDQKEFAKRIAIQTVRIFLPIALRAAGALFPKHTEALEAAAKACEAVTGLTQAHAAACAASYAASDAASYAASDAASYAARAASCAASYAARAASCAASDAASCAAACAASCAAACAASCAAKKNSILKMAADMGVAVLKELKSPGTAWLFLCDKE